MVPDEDRERVYRAPDDATGTRSGETYTGRADEAEFKDPLSPQADIGAEGEAAATSRVIPDMSSVQKGWEVYDSSGDKIGEVHEVGTNYLMTQKGFIFHKDVYIPASAVGRIEDGRVDLTMTKDEINNLDWAGPPPEQEEALSAAESAASGEEAVSPRPQETGTEDVAGEYAGGAGTANPQGLTTTPGEPEPGTIRSEEPAVRREGFPEAPKEGKEDRQL